MNFDIFSDGGCVGKNPSPEGGTFAWCHIGTGDDNRGVRLDHASGHIIPSDIGLPRVTNNYTELLAAVLAMHECPNGWSGTVFTDSLITLYRIRRSKRQAKLKGIPEELQKWLADVKLRLGAYKVVLLAGHPTYEELANGKTSKGVPVSEHNVWCDEQCKAVARRFRRDRVATR